MGRGRAASYLFDSFWSSHVSEDGFDFAVRFEQYSDWRNILPSEMSLRFMKSTRRTSFRIFRLPDWGMLTIADFYFFRLALRKNQESQFLLH